MRHKVFIYFCLAAGTLALYWKTGTFDFINYDDQDYVYANSHVITGLSLNNVYWALTTSVMGNWIPLTWLSHMLDCQLFGLAPKGHHYTNVILHTANTLLLCYALNLATGRFISSIFIAVLFSCHPLHVESVAWIAERKDLLSAFFFTLTIIFYLKYVHKPGLKRYLIVTTTYILGLLSKPMLVTLPIILLIFDFWPLCRFNRLTTTPVRNSKELFTTVLLEKIPLLFLSGIICIITITIQKDHGALLQLDRISMPSRLTNASVSYATYVLKTFLPSKLAIFYPLNANPTWQVLVSIIFLLSMTSFAVITAKRYPFILAGWLWFVVMLTPVIGVLQVGLQSRADRYTYLPLIGIFVIITWGTAELLNTWQWKYKKYLAALTATIFISGLTYTTFQQLNYWKDGIELYTHTLSVTHHNFTVHYNLAATLANKGRIDEAIYHYQQAIETAPVFFEEAHISLAFEFENLQRYHEAMYHYAEILKKNPENSTAKEHMQVIMRNIYNSR